MSQSTRFTSAVCLAILFICSLPSLRAQQIADDQPAWSEYKYLLRSSTLEWLPQEPFQLKVDLTINDLDGQPIDTGTAVERWAAERFVTVNTQLIHENSAMSGQDDIAHTRERYLIRQIIAALVRPFPSAAKQETFNVHQFQRSGEDGDLNCFSIVGPLSGKSSDEAYCTNSSNQLSVMIGPASLLVRRTNFRRFNFHEVPMDIALLYNGKIAITAHLKELDSDTTPPAANVLSRPGGFRDSSFIPSVILEGHRLKAPSPKYPKMAKKQHIYGTVLLAAVINKQGIITGLEVVSSPDPLLSESALNAVQKWTYTPYLLKGQPTEVDTTITVNYALGK